MLSRWCFKPYVIVWACGVFCQRALCHSVAAWYCLRMASADILRAVQKQSAIADLKEWYEVRWTQFTSRKADAPLAGYSDIPFPVSDENTASLTDVVLYGTKVWPL